MRMRVLLICVVLLGATVFGSWLAAQSKPAPSTKDSSSKRDKDDAVLLGAIGSLGASHLYQTYLNVGLIADGRAEGTYDAQTAQQVLATVLGLVDTVDKQLEQVAKTDLSRDDKEALEKISKQSALIRQMATALQAFWKSNKKEDGAKYEKCRKQSWEGLKQLLGLDKE